MRRLASKEVKAKAFWDITERLTSAANPKIAKSGFVSISVEGIFQNVKICKYFSPIIK